MLEEWELPLGYSGSMQADSMTRKKLAQESGRFNLEKFPIFKELFPGDRKNYNSNLLHNFYKILYSKNWPPISRRKLKAMHDDTWKITLYRVSYIQ